MRTALLLLLLGGTALAAPPVRDPDWPCQSVKVPNLSLASVWNGPSLDPYLGTWTKDADAAALAQRLAQRRVPVDEAEQAIKQFAAQAGTAKQERLLNLMAGLFSTMDEERTSVITGLSRFGRRQKELGGELRGTMESLRKEQDKPDADQAKVAQLTEQVTWGTRVFGQRQTSVRYACDVPNLIEERLGALARVIQSAMG
jgi:hypothetical protein